MHILITGAKGTLGRYLCPVLKDHTLITPDTIYLDVRNHDQVMSFADKKIDSIIHLAAETDHIACEFNPSEAYLINTIGTANMIDLAKSLNIPMLYLSTCGIFDGHNTNIPNPINHYSRSKYYGELLCQQYHKHRIVRTGWLLGGGPYADKKFVGKIYRQIQEGAKTLYAITDVYGSPTYAEDLAQEIKYIILNEGFGHIFYRANMSFASRYEVASHMISCLGLSNTIKLIPKTYEEYFQQFPQNCHHTKNEVCSSSILTPMRPWQEALSDYLKKEFINAAK
jgi:dTDP-4-dehydrorhamnose reductase